MKYLLVLLLISTQAFASLEKLTIEKLNLDYTGVQGAGDYEKLSLSLSTFMPGPYPLSVEKIENTFVISNPMLQLTWEDPFAVFLGLESLLLKNTNVDIGRLNHSASSDSVVFKPATQSDYKLEKFSFKCVGASNAWNMEDRLMEDCRESMLLTAEQVDVPLDSFLVKILSELPPMPVDVEKPLYDLYLKSERGEVYLYFLARYYVLAGVRAWGHLSYENDLRTIVFRLDQVKFGILPITSLVWRELEKIQHPNLKINRPYIRISR